MLPNALPLVFSSSRDRLVAHSELRLVELAIYSEE
jgi:hypothetical protein